MPFSRYLQSNEREHAHDSPDDDLASFSTNVHFQLPNLIFNAPSVPPGGGAEALPAGLYPSSSSLSWFAPPDAYPFASHPPSSSPPAHHPSSSSFPYPHNPSHHPPYPPNLPTSLPSPIGLPIYSASGFDLLSLLARVVTRPYPKIYLGPVDLSCSFVVTDTRRFDAPIVYASPSFLRLTGYEENEVLGRNCRFLQAPGGVVHRGQDRMHTSPDAVSHMRKNIVADKECQVSIINYRKDGSAFINMVSIIPIRGGEHSSPEDGDDIVYHVGFQVDLTEQPKSILSKLKDGTYVVNYSDKSVPPPPSRDWRTSSMTMRGVSKHLRALLSDPSFTASFRLSTSTHASTAIALSNSPSEPITLDPYDGNKPLHMFILDRSPDFLHVVSLKGAFLYVAPAVRHVLGYDPDELVGRSLTDFCHPADCVPLMRELKEASATPGPLLLTTTNAPSSSSSPSNNPNSHLDTSAQSASSSATAPRPVDLLFRMQAKGRGYVWIECRGRLHVEPGKGRKAIILSGRIRNMPYLEWSPIARAGGLVSPSLRSPPSPTSPSLAAVNPRDDDADDRSFSEREFWGLLSTNATFLYVGAAVRDVLGWGAGEVIGKRLADFVGGNSLHEVLMAIEVEMTKVLTVAGGAESSGLVCNMHTKDGTSIPVHVVLYRSCAPPSPPPLSLAPPTSSVTNPLEALGNGGDPGSQAPIVCQVKLCDGSLPPPVRQIVHPHSEGVFLETELDRASSWQYERQQLKFRNERLAGEVAALEAGIAKKIRRKQASSGLGPSGSPTAKSTTPASLSATGRVNTKFSAPPSSHSGIPPPPPPPAHQQSSQQAQTTSHMHIRFVPDGHARPEPPQSSRSHNPSPALLPPSSSLLPHQQQRPMRSGGMGPPPEFLSGRGGEPVAGAGARMRQSTESSLQGWSSYNYEQAHGEKGLLMMQNRAPGTGASGSRDRRGDTTYHTLPVKRGWDDSVRDPGGGGGA